MGHKYYDLQAQFPFSGSVTCLLSGLSLARRLECQPLSEWLFSQFMVHSSCFIFMFQHLIDESPNYLSLFSQERLLSVVLGLIRQKRFRFLHLYKDEVYSIIKGSIKEVYFIAFHTGMMIFFNEEFFTQAF